MGRELRSLGDGRSLDRVPLRPASSAEIVSLQWPSRQFRRGIASVSTVYLQRDRPRPLPNDSPPLV